MPSTYFLFGPVSSTFKALKDISVSMGESFAPHSFGIRKSLIIHSHPVYGIKRLPKFVTKFSNKRVLFKKARGKFRSLAVWKAAGVGSMIDKDLRDSCAKRELGK